MNMNIDWTKVFRRFWKLGKALLICLVISTVVGFIVVGAIMGTAAHFIGGVGSVMAHDLTEQQADMKANRTAQEPGTRYYHAMLPGETQDEFARRERRQKMYYGR